MVTNLLQLLTLKRLRKVGGGVWGGFGGGGVVSFNIILKHIFPENFHEFPQVVQKIYRNYLSILAIFINFPQVFGFFDITLLQRNK